MKHLRFLVNYLKQFNRVLLHNILLFTEFTNSDFQNLINDLQKISNIADNTANAFTKKKLIIDTIAGNPDVNVISNVIGN